MMFHWTFDWFRVRWSPDEPRLLASNPSPGGSTSSFSTHAVTPEMVARPPIPVGNGKSRLWAWQELLSELYQRSLTETKSIDDLLEMG
jgi:hypothetical protein